MCAPWRIAGSVRSTMAPLCVFGKTPENSGSAMWVSAWQCAMGQTAQTAARSVNRRAPSPACALALAQQGGRPVPCPLLQAFGHRPGTFRHARLGKGSRLPLLVTDGHLQRVDPPLLRGFSAEQDWVCPTTATGNRLTMTATRTDNEERSSHRPPLSSPRSFTEVMGGDG